MSRIDLSGLSREELAQICEDQADKLKRYETRLRDTVNACKSLMRQKEALEASLQVLNQQKPDDSTSISSTASAESSLQGSSAGAPDISGSVASGGEDALRKQLATLSQSLSTITAEKTRLEQQTVADKKRLKQEFDAKVQAASSENDRLIEENQLLKRRLKELKKTSSSREGSVPRDSPSREETNLLVERLKKELKEAEMNIFTLQQTVSEMETERQLYTAERERAELAEQSAAEGEERLRTMENQLADMTVEIGRYEQSSLRDKKIIEKLEAQLNGEDVKHVPSSIGATRHMISFGTQTDVVRNRVDSLVKQSSSEIDHSHCKERIDTLEGALAVARKDFADAVARTWLASAAIPVEKTEDQQLTLKSLEQKQPPDLILRDPPKQEKTKSDQYFEKEQSIDSRFMEQIMNKEPSPPTAVLLSDMERSGEYTDELLRRDSSLSFNREQQVSGNAAPLLFYETEISRMENALRESRSSQRSLERRFREIEQRLTAENLQLHEQLEHAQKDVDELRRQTRALPPDSAKLEFVRQVAMRHLSTHDGAVKNQTATVLATALSFPNDFLIKLSSQQSKDSSLANTVTRYFKP